MPAREYTTRSTWTSLRSGGKAGEYGFYVFIDPTRMCGAGSAAATARRAGRWKLRAWTWRDFKATGAAIVHNTHGDPFPRMISATNYAKLCAATMFTLFFAGNTFAPKTRVEGAHPGLPQTHYFEAVKEVAAKLKGPSHVLGYDTLNEPSPGWIGWRDLLQHQSLARMGATPTHLAEPCSWAKGCPRRWRCGTSASPASAGGASNWWTPGDAGQAARASV